MGEFTGFPHAAVEFYAGLEEDCTRDFWQAHKGTYAAAVRQPMEDLIGALEPTFGEGKVFRPNRDVRFSADRSPYKTHQGGYCASPGGSAYYVQIGADGLFVGGGRYSLAPDQVARYRRAVDEDVPGQELVRIIDSLAAKGFTRHGEQLKTRPRGVAEDHPRLELLRHKSIALRLDHGVPEWLDSPRVLEEVEDAWDALRPFVGWMDQHVGLSELEPRRKGGR